MPVRLLEGPEARTGGSRPILCDKCPGEFAERVVFVVGDAQNAVVYDDGWVCAESHIDFGEDVGDVIRFAQVRWDVDCVGGSAVSVVGA